MSDWSVLSIGRLQLRFRNSIPSFLGFLFDEADFYSAKSEECEGEWWWEELGYATSVRDAVETFESQGYSLAVFSSIYEFFRDDIEDVYRLLLGESIAEQGSYHKNDEEIDAEVERYLSSFPASDSQQKLGAFSDLLRGVLRDAGAMTEFDAPYALSLGDGRTLEIPAPDFLRVSGGEASSIDFESLQMYLQQHVHRLPPGICQVGLFFDEHLFEEYSEIVWLTFVRLALDSADEDAEVRLELSDILEDEEEAKAIPSDLARSLVQKVNLYNRVFQVLFEREDHFRELDRKTRGRDLLARCRRENTANAKGRLLEQLAQLLFTDGERLILSDKRVSTGDEEIDLVLRNNVDRPFWVALGSPLLLVECKNWTGPVPSAAIRDFEMKLVNHGNMARIGVFVALNGFTGPVEDQMKRSSRADHHIALIRGNDIDEYLSGDDTFLVWLERKLSELI